MAFLNYKGRCETFSYADMLIFKLNIYKFGNIKLQA